MRYYIFLFHYFISFLALLVLAIGLMELKIVDTISFETLQITALGMALALLIIESSPDKEE